MCLHYTSVITLTELIFGSSLAGIEEEHRQTVCLRLYDFQQGDGLAVVVSVMPLFIMNDSKMGHTRRTAC